MHEQANVLSGKTVFRIMDSVGLPLDIIVQELRAKGAAFDILDFVKAAKKSGNYNTPKGIGRLKERILETMLDKNAKPEWSNGKNLSELVTECFQAVYSDR